MSPEMVARDDPAARRASPVPMAEAVRPMSSPGPTTAPGRTSVVSRSFQVLRASILALGAFRATCYLLYAYASLPWPLEAFDLESKMVLLAHRAEQGMSLYPA